MSISGAKMSFEVLSGGSETGHKEEMRPPVHD